MVTGKYVDGYRSQVVSHDICSTEYGHLEACATLVGLQITRQINEQAEVRLELQ